MRPCSKRHFFFVSWFGNLACKAKYHTGREQRIIMRKERICSWLLTCTPNVETDCPALVTPLIKPKVQRISTCMESLNYKM